MKSTDIYMIILVLAFGIVAFKFYQSNNSFENYISESNKVRNINECLNEQCFIKPFLSKGDLSSKKLLAIIPERGCYECEAGFEMELLDTLKKFNNIEFSQISDTTFRAITLDNHIQFEHVTLLVMDKYKTHYIFEYHPSFPQKEAKTEALFAFLDRFDQ